MPEAMLSKIYSKQINLKNLLTDQLIFISTLVVFLLIVIISLSGLKLLHDSVEKQTIGALQEVLNSTSTTLSETWLQSQLMEATSQVSDPLIINSVETLLLTTRIKDKLIEQPAQNKIKEYFHDYLKSSNALGLSILTRDSVNIASTNNSDLGQVNFIHQYYPERLGKVFLGEQQFIPLSPSTISLLNDQYKMIENYPTISIVVPIKNARSQVIAALSVHLNPTNDFTRIANSSRLGESGKSYLLDFKGQVITKSPFTDQLQQFEQQSFNKLAENTINPSSIVNNKLAYQDYRGIQVFGVNKWDDKLGVTFVTEIDEYEALMPYREMRSIIATMLVTIVLLATIFFYILTRYYQRSTNKDKLREMYDNLPFPHQILSEDGIFVNVNNTFLDLLGYSRDEIIGTKFINILDKRSAILWQNMQLTSKEGRKIHCELALHDKSGVTIDIEMQGVFDKGPDSIFNRFYCIWHDVSKHKKSNIKVPQEHDELRIQIVKYSLKLKEKSIELQNMLKQLLQSEQLSQGLLRLSEDSVILINKQGNIDLANESVIKMFGFTPIELQGESIEKILPKGLVNELLQRYIKQENVKKDFTVNLLIAKRRDGTDFPVKVGLSSIENENSSVTICKIQDISEQIKLEERLQQSQKMEVIGQLTGGIAHDFNNSLSCILGYTELALDNDNLEKEKLDKYLKAIYISGIRARDMITSIMDFSRTNSAPPHKLLDLSQLLDEIKMMLHPILSKDIDIVCSIENDIPKILVDSTQIIQAVMNLCINARDELKDHGYIKLQLHKTVIIEQVCNSCRKRLTGDYIELSVSDNGGGIEIENIENIFDPFVTTKEVGMGTGLGLSMVHKIIHANGGHIIVNSILGESTTFRLLLPIADNAPIENDDKIKEHIH